MIWLLDSFQTFLVQVIGFPLHLRCSDTGQVLAAVERTGIHLCEHERAEFALAVYIRCYPNDVLSVWVYLANLIPT